MNSLIRSILTPFASTATGAIIAVIIALFLFGIKDQIFIRIFAFVGALFGAAPDILRLISDFIKAAGVFQADSAIKHEAMYFQTEPSPQEIERIEKAATEQEARKKLLAEEHEARRPICTHCGRKTEPICSYRKPNGAPDMRYKNNPILCNRCYKPYAGVRPWKLPHNTS